MSIEGDFEKLTSWLFGAFALLALMGLTYAFLKNAEAQRARMSAEVKATECEERAMKAEREVGKMRDMTESQKAEIERVVNESREALIACLNQTSKSRTAK